MCKFQICKNFTQKKKFFFTFCKNFAHFLQKNYRIFCKNFVKKFFSSVWNFCKFEIYTLILDHVKSLLVFMKLIIRWFCPFVKLVRSAVADLRVTTMNSNNILCWDILWPSKGPSELFSHFLIHKQAVRNSAAPSPEKTNQPTTTSISMYTRLWRLHSL